MTLDIQNTTIDTVLRELVKWVQDRSGSYDISQTRKAYEYLSEHARTDTEAENIR